MSKQVDRGPSQAPTSAGAKVNVFCNLPNGLVLQLEEKITTRELVMGGGSREVILYQRVGLPVKIKGTASNIDNPITHRVVMGYAVTEGVDKDFFDTWLEAHKGQAYVKNGCIFAHEKLDFGSDKAVDQSKGGFRSGLEPLERDGDYRAPRSTDTQKQVGQEEGQAKKVAEREPQSAVQ